MLCSLSYVYAETIKVSSGEIMVGNISVIKDMNDGISRVAIRSVQDQVHEPLTGTTFGLRPDLL